MVVSLGVPRSMTLRGRCTNAVPEAEQRRLTSKEVELESR